jgi:CDP-Glycerol:Poly(glycerophosphate) glycerophosphotransferase
MSALGTAIGIILAKVRGRSLARTIARSPAPITPVAVYFADAPSGLYQLRHWYSTLEALGAVYPTSIITSDPSTFRAVHAQTTLPVTFAAGPTELSRVLGRQQVGVVLYPNHNALNFRVLRFADPVHVFIGHGESAKDSSVSRQLKAYDYTYVADAASIGQLRSIRGYDADAAAVVVGSPWLGFLGSAPASWRPDDRTVVLYAPTWEGDRPTMDYGSVETQGEAIVAAVLGAPNLRLIYRPHPWLGRVRSTSADADARIRRAISAAGQGDVVDTGEYGWTLNASDLCITDVSSVAFDARALGKPVLVTVPTSTSIPPVPDAAYAGMVRLEKTDAADIRALIDETLAARTARPTDSATSMDALVAAIGEALLISGDSTL